MTSTWPHHEIMKFLELYRGESVIWNPKHKYHKDKNKVSDAWSRIGEAMGVPIEDLKRKKETLMTAFRNNLRKKKDSIRSGAGLDDIYMPSWPFFDVMESFLKDVYECKTVLNTEDQVTLSPQDEDSMIQRENNENQDPNTETETSNIQIPVQRRRSRNPPELEETNKEMKRAFSTLNTVLSKQSTKDSEDVCDLYGKLLAKRLRTFTDIEKQELMYEIDGILLKKRQAALSTHRSGHYVVQSPSQIILQTKRPGRGYTLTSAPVTSQTYIPRPTSSISTYCPSTTSYDTDGPLSNVTACSPPYFFPNANVTPGEVPVQISIPEQSLNLETQQSPSILHQAFMNANIDDSQENYE